MSQYETNRDALVGYLESQGWNYDVREDGDGRYVASMGFSVDCRLGSVRLLAIADGGAIQSIGICPLNAGVKDYDMVVEYLTRANYGLRVGNFEFDHADGEVRYQSCLVSCAGTPEQENVECAVDMPIRMFDRYGDGLVRALMGLGEPEADVAAAEA